VTTSAGIIYGQMAPRFDDVPDADEDEYTAVDAAETDPDLTPVQRRRDGRQLRAKSTTTN